MVSRMKVSLTRWLPGPTELTSPDTIGLVHWTVTGLGNGNL